MAAGVYDPRFEHDACGVGFVARVSGAPEYRHLEMALEALSRLAHRGAVAADGRSGDGAGVLFQIPLALFRNYLADNASNFFAVGVLFVDRNEQDAQQEFSEALRLEGLNVIGWRDVPVNVEALGDSARNSLPLIQQAVITPCADISADQFERRLYLARKRFERVHRQTYVVSLSSRTIVYKALCAGAELGNFYPDLRDPRVETAFALFHQRYATNTSPAWSLAQPFRMLAHNGEINTIWANREWMRARESELPASVLPALRADGSDSCNLDEAVELLTQSGRDLVQALSTLIVPAWQHSHKSCAARPFYRQHAPLMEPWDGPAALTFSDGRFVGAALDRNGLRPLRYAVTDDGMVLAGSEAGLFDVADENIVSKGRLGPGEMIAVDLHEKKFLHDGAVKSSLPSPSEWETPIELETLGSAEELAGPAVHHAFSLESLQALFGYTREDLKLVLAPMARDGKEPIWSMGDDAPVSALSRSPRNLYSFFRQRFAQVTNPPIDPLRERCMMSLNTWLGGHSGLMNKAGNSVTLELSSPVLNHSALHTIKTQTILPASLLDCTFAADEQELRDVIGRLQSRAEEEIRAGAAILVLSDAAVTTNRLAVPMALAVGAVHHHLIRCGLRMRADIIAESGDCWDVHHLAVLIGYGSAAVCPWLALRSCIGEEEKLLEVFNLGLRKVMSKLGISDVSSYRGGQFFEILGLDNSVIEDCFAGTPALAGGVGYREIRRESLRRAGQLNNGQQRQELPDFGSIRYRSDKHSDQHAWQPPVVRALQQAVGSSRAQVPADKQGQSWTDFNVLSSDLGPHNLRDLLSIRFFDNPIDIDEVEPAREIARRFVASAMSLGSISPEAHRTLSIAMNRLGGRSNTGEGGEDPDVYDHADHAENKIKQVASGRFGVTTEYLARAEELEIKIAQGAKPGEGGQLPGAKVTDLIARLRHAQPGMSLISPPPHHDIYSIEDIAQLIHDLKEVNPRARVGVKLVSQAGIGTVASGVAKAYADYILLSGHAGGTGAAPLTGIKHAGTPWELGLAETQQTLVRNGVRGRVSLRVDGGLRTARDIVIAALLGAEEFGFGTAALVALGCDMARQCHLNTCPTGIATQKPELRAKFRGTPEQVIAYFMKLAEDVRALLARLGLRSVEQAVGRVDLLEQSRWDGGFDLSKLLFREPGAAIRRENPRNDRPHQESAFGPAFTRRIVDAVANGAAYESDFLVRNSDRSIGAAISGELVRTFAKRQHGHVHLNLSGSAGQSFGAFCTSGVHLLLEGEANDYVGKGLSGGVLVLRPRGQARLAPNRNVILGNVALYGATAGRLFAAGCAGERFAVRNSGAIAIVEGIGDHGCEYMTGGCVAVLGPTGANFGAGMTGGVAYLFDPDDRAANKINGECVSVCRVNDAQLHRLWTLISVHAAFTGSLWAREILANWHTHRHSFCAVLPVGVAAPETAPAIILGGQTADTATVPILV